MSVEIPGVDKEHSAIVEAVSLGVAQILRSSGVEIAVANTTGAAAARYAIELLLSATDGCMETYPGCYSDEMMVDSIAVIADCAIHPENTDYYQAYMEADNG